uniref:Uncharacterized protein n=1 Tax=Oxyrrhis marina TaxID=2969 RepID=A0A7S3XGE7_OXYMA
MDRVGVFSFARHHPEFYNGVHAKNSKLGGGEMVSWWLDCVRTCLHELGHLLGMRHCIYFRCLMNGNNGPGDSAGRTTFLCPVCLRKVLSVCAGDECGSNAGCTNSRTTARALAATVPLAASQILLRPDYSRS